MAKSPSPDLWFDAGSRSYWLRAGDRYAPMSEREVVLHMHYSGTAFPSATDTLKPSEVLLVETQRQRAVDYAGPLAGYPVGCHTLAGGQRVLVTRGVEIPQPAKEPEPGFLGDFFAELMPDKGAAFAFFYWLRHAYTCLRDRNFRPGQVCAFAGPSRCGKGFAILTISHLLGGRQAKAFEWLMGKSQFNGELAGAEVWVCDDEDAQSDARSRRSFGNAIKRATVSNELRIRKMHAEAVSLNTFRRVVLAVNDEPENLTVLPILDDSIADKIHLFRCERAKVVGEDFPDNIRRMKESAPGFLAWLLKLRVPDRLREPRMGSVSYHDASLLESLSDLSPERRLENIIDEVVFGKKDADEVWTGSAEELERVLRNSPFQFSVEKLLSYSSACGVYLGRLEKQNPDRYGASTVRGKKRWKISRPEGD